MNFDPTLSTGLAVAMSLFSAFLWGSWFIALKYLGKYPISAFIMTLFTTSLVFVWLVGFASDGGALWGNIASVYTTDPSRVFVTILCGILYVLGMNFSMTALKTIGLSLTQPIQSSINILVGTLVAGLIGGVPQQLSVARIGVGVLFLLGAVLLSMLAGRWRTQAQASGLAHNDLVFSANELWKSVGMLAVSSLFIPAYTLGLSYGLRTVSHPDGLAVLPFMALLATGAFLGASLSAGVTLTVKKQWGEVWRAPWRIHVLGMIPALCHYGGNIIHTFATTQLSSVVSWPLGVTSGLWTQIWGLVYGEFRGFPRRVYVALFSGLALYILGAAIIAFG